MTPPELEPTLPARLYLDDEAFARERELILFSEWFCVGRCEDIGQVGDFLQADVAGESVLLVRRGDGGISGFYNVCRHRGCRLLLEPASTPGDRCGPAGRFSNVIRCPYHSWTYGLEGELRSARFLVDLPKEELSLYPIGVASWGGFLFVRLSPDKERAAADSLADQLGEVPERISRYPLDEVRSAHRIVYEVAANWKVILENYNECYHCGPVHPELSALVPAFKERGGGDLDWEDGIPHRQGAWTFTLSGTSDRSPFPSLNEAERTRHKGELLYPNLMLSLSADHVTAFYLWPRSPAHTTIVCDFLFSPSEIGRLGFDPRDAVELWDLVNKQDWAICEGVQGGMGSRAFEGGYFAPMEDDSKHIGRYIEERLGRAE